MPDGARSHPALAGVAARAASAGSPAVLFNVVHFGARTTTAPQSQLTGISPPTARDKPATETLVVNLAGIGFRVHTWAPDVPSKPEGTVDAKWVPPMTPVINDRGITREVYGGAVVTNPGFLYDSAQSVELLITLSHKRWKPTFADSLMISTIYHQVTSAALAGEGTPILFLQSPAAPFKDAPPSVRQDGSGENPRLTNGMALRMLVGLDEARPDARLELLRGVAAVAAEHGLGLQVADRRFGRVRGEWWTVTHPHAQTYRLRRAALFPWATSEIPSSVQLLTFVGPARVGSSAAIASDLVTRNIGILAISEAVLQETAFINIVVPVAPARRAEQVAAGSCRPIVEGLGKVASDCGLTRRQEVRGRSVIGDSPATDYRVLATGPLTVRIEESAKRRDRAVWISWDLPLPPGGDKGRLDVAQLVLTQLLSSGKVAHARVDYYRSWVSPSGRVHGNAKIAVLLDGVKDDKVGEELSTLCPWTQREVISQLVRQRIALRTIKLRVVWRERWLGRTNAA
ncbi:hypothetical protein EV193_101371 [Herbihabitans rhizosphaerae]|uniref:Uncharacterized protein n=1 Tax=Herbihabitans rhizosphaerae TaxID=1872711 RepID=A0A4Q7L5A0_9PSEU|nr:hypothetical protein [Herbihabitans rhizosphaerae]RZS44495.1 hypothetical protein EV193_101371 [Herbihabitans rhizosphaerae]